MLYIRYIMWKEAGNSGKIINHNRESLFSIKKEKTGNETSGM